MKILQVNCVYQNGSTGKITYDIHKELQKRGIESIVCYGRGERVNESHVYKTCSELYSKCNHAWSMITGLMYGGCHLSTRKLISVIKKERPDVVHLQCLNGYFVNLYGLISWLKNADIKTVLTLHAEFMYTANCGHAFACDKWKTGCGHCPRYKQETKSIFFDRTAHSWKKMKAAFDGFDHVVVVSVSPWLMQRAKLSPILADKEHQVVLNGLDTETVFYAYGKDSNQHVKKELHIPLKQKVIFHVTPNFNNDSNHIKGGYYVIELAKRMPKVKFVVAGNAKEGVCVPDNMLLLGNVVNQKRLAQLYSMADITVLTSKKETFSMVVAESLSCGTPVIGFEAGGPEQIALKEYSAFVPFGNVNALESAVKNMLQSVELYHPADISEKAGIYAKSEMVQNYIRIYKHLMGMK